MKFLKFLGWSVIGLALLPGLAYWLLPTIGSMLITQGLTNRGFTNVVLHLDYPSTWAAQELVYDIGGQAIGIQHHLAHIASVLTEHKRFPEPSETTLGIALDGDGDRLIVVDEQGRVVDGDHIMAICASELMARRKLRKKTLVATVMSNLGLEIAMQNMGGRMVRTQVGDRYVVEEMRNRGYNFGGEQSGHLVFLDHNTTGDGILAALQLMAIMIKRNKPISELATIMESFPQTLKNVRTKSKIDPDRIKGFSKKIAALEKKLGKTGRILVRPSGTEPVIRVMVEGQDEVLIDTMADELCEMISHADQ